MRPTCYICWGQRWAVEDISTVRFQEFDHRHRVHHAREWPGIERVDLRIQRFRSSDIGFITSEWGSGYGLCVRVECVRVEMCSVDLFSVLARRACGRWWLRYANVPGMLSACISRCLRPAWGRWGRVDCSIPGVWVSDVGWPDRTDNLEKNESKTCPINAASCPIVCRFAW